MTSLLDLPSELLLVIAKLLLYTSPERIYWKIPFYQLHHAFRRAFDHNQPRRVKDIHSLLLTTRRLKALLQPVFYRDVFVANLTISLAKSDQWRKHNEHSHAFYQFNICSADLFSAFFPTLYTPSHSPRIVQCRAFPEDFVKHLDWLKHRKQVSFVV